jgi:hypothetical protein
MVREEEEEEEEGGKRDWVPPSTTRSEKVTVCRYAAPDHMQQPHLAIQLLRGLKKGTEKEEGATREMLNGSLEARAWH